MKCLLKPFSLTAALLLGACSHYSNDLSSLDNQYLKAGNTQIAAAPAAPQDIAPAAGGPEFATATNTKALGQYLAREYYDLAKYENDKVFDYKAAKQYTEKAVSASKGQITAPSRISSFDVPQNKIPELNEAREQLINALRSGQLAGSEQQLASAQTNFDCWLERAEEASDESHYASCKEGFNAAMAQIIMPAAGAPTQGVISSIPETQASTTQMFEIGFAAQGDAIDTAAYQSIEQAAAFLNSPQGAGYTAIITGFTPLQADEKARLTATSRALKVREALMAKDVADAAIKPQIAPVPQTADIVPVAGGPAADKGGLDRKVQIHLVASSATSNVSTTTVVTTPAIAAPAPMATQPAAVTTTTTIYNDAPVSPAPAVKATAPNSGRIYN